MQCERSRPIDNENSKRKKLEFWVEQYSDPLYAWAFYKTRSKEIAEDLVQETFFSAIKSYDKCINKEKPKTWLFTILNNKVIDFYRKSSTPLSCIDSLNPKNVPPDCDDLFDEYGNWTTAARKILKAEEKHLLDIPEFNQLLEQCLGELPRNWEIAILSKYIKNKKGREICQELDISQPNYWQILHRSKIFLKACLEKYWKE